MIFYETSPQCGRSKFQVQGSKWAADASLDVCKCNVSFRINPPRSRGAGFFANANDGRHQKLRWLMVLCLCLFCCGSGCSTSRYLEKAAQKWEQGKQKIFHSFRVSGAGLNRKVGILRFENRSEAQDSELEAVFQTQIGEQLSESCRHVSLVLPDTSGFQALLPSLPRGTGGRIDNLALAKAGRRLGLNAVVSGTLMDIRVKTEERGFWWLKDTHYSIEVSLLLVCFDTETGAKLLDKMEISEIEVEAVDLEAAERLDKTFFPQIRSAVQSAAETLGREVCLAVRQESWKAYVISVDPTGARISAGRNSGLTENKKLVAYESGRLIEGAGGERFLIPGRPAADLKIKQLADDYAVVEVLGGKSVGVGDVVKLE